MAEKRKRLTRGEAIRKHCIECSGGSIYEPRHCLITRCNLYPFRNGYEETELYADVLVDSD